MVVLTFEALRQVNVLRCVNSFHHPLRSWSLDDWITAVGGELGEAMNLVKKLNRERDGIVGNSVGYSELVTMLADEIADAVIYLDLTAASETLEFGSHDFDALRAFDRNWMKPKSASDICRKALIAIGAMGLQAEKLAGSGRAFTPFASAPLEKLKAAAFDLLLRLDDLAEFYDIDLGMAVTAKFNATSKKLGFVEKLWEVA